MDPSTKLSSACSSPGMPKEGEATVKCALCAKPLAKQSAFEKNGGWFCGVPAAAQFATQQKHYDTHEAREKGRKLKGLIRNLVLLVILAAIAGGCYMFYKQNPDKVRGWFGKAKDATSQGLDATKDKLKSNSVE